ncbi:MAG: penicillin acylase family protein, partial [Vicinamibacterales bacterium]
MNKLPFIVAVTCLSCACQVTGNNTATNKDVAAWEQRAQNVTIIRDDWGIPHVYGKTDADVVFGVMFAQAEDDFN